MTIGHSIARLGAALALTATACGSGTDAVGPPADLSPAAQIGWETARDKGCMSCHGLNGAGGTGPAWDGIAGSTRVLDDGTEVVADRDYLVRSIVDPQSERVTGYNINMPTVSLDDTELSAVVDYLEELRCDPLVNC